MNEKRNLLLEILEFFNKLYYKAIPPPKKRSGKYMTRPDRKYMKLVSKRRNRYIILWRQTVNL